MLLKETGHNSVLVIQTLTHLSVLNSMHDIHLHTPGEPGQHPDNQQGLVTEEARPKLAKPPLYKVLLLNDDYTPMEFVVGVLLRFFHMPVEKATQIMLKVHTEGKAVCGVYSRDVAETKSQQVNEFSRENQQPLLCDVEIDQ